MILKSIKMENFRQYYKEHVVEFSDSYRNITLILGENNAGKTGIYRALIYGLYGERYLAQDSKDKKIHLVNLFALEQEKITEASVTLKIIHGDKTYIIKRVLKAVKIGQKVKESKEDELYLDVIDEIGQYIKNYKTDYEDIQGIINEILDESIKEFFLFDGEKIETLARSDNDSRREVRNGIVKLMNIDKIEETTKIISKIYKSEKRNLTQKSENNNLLEINEKIDNLENEMSRLNSNILEKEKNIKNLSIELSNIKLELKEYDYIRDRFRRIEELESDRKSLINDLKNAKNNLATYNFKNGYNLILSDYYMNLNTKLERELLEKDDVVPIHIIKKSLDLGKCICCNQDLYDEDSLNYIETLRDNYKPSEVTEFMSTYSRELSSQIDSLEENQEKLNHELENILEYENQLAKKESIIKKYKSEYDHENIDSKEVEDKQKRLGELETEERLDKQKLEEWIERRENIKIELDKLDRKRDKLLKIENELDYELKRLEFIRVLKEKIDKIFKKYVNLTKENLGKETTKTFKKLIDDVDTSLVEKILINDNYQIEIYNDQGLDITQDISQGQQMIVALAFVTSLAKLASKSENKIDYPLFMDTPFSRLSQLNRKNLIENLPKLSNQWIPLLTDTELAEYEKPIFMENKRVGKAYLIKAITKHKSEIIDITEEWIE